jgi:ribokinase
MFVDQLPRVEESVAASCYDRSVGGKAANQAAAAALAGFSSELVSALGDDAAGAYVRSQLERLGVDLSSCRSTTGAGTGRSFITVDRVGQQHIATWPGASNSLNQHDLDAIVERSIPSDIVSVQGEVDLAVTSITQSDLRVAINPSPTARFGADEEWFDFAVVIVNEHEYAELSPAINAAPMVVVTRGSRGADLYERQRRRFTAWSEPVEVVDTTGAGDAFAGVFLAHWAAYGVPAEALRWGVAAATLSVQHQFCAPSYPSRHEIEHQLSRCTLKQSEESET